MKLNLIGALFVAVISATGCGTMISGSKKTVQIKAQEGAKISVVNADGKRVVSGTTSLTADLPRGAGYWRAAGYQVNVSQPGYKSKSVDILPTFNGWYLLNVFPIVGSIGALIIDPIYGGFYSLDTDALDINLDPIGSAADIANSSREAEAERLAKASPVSRHDYTATQKAKELQCTPLASPVVSGYRTALETLTFECQDGRKLSFACSSIEGCGLRGNN